MQEYRETCLKCRKSKSTCICSQISPFRAGFDVVILIHPKENRKRVGTGRLTHLCIENSYLFEGVDFTEDPRVNELLSSSDRKCVLLYPGADALDVSQHGAALLEQYVPESLRLTVFLLDASWFFAKKMFRLSRNLHSLPKIAFIPPARSQYQIRRQPQEHCYSSVEATHFLIHELARSRRWVTTGDYGILLRVFSEMVQVQLKYVRQLGQRAFRGDRRAATSSSAR